MLAPVPMVIYIVGSSDTFVALSKCLYTHCYYSIIYNLLANLVSLGGQ